MRLDSIKKIVPWISSIATANPDSDPSDGDNHFSFKFVEVLVQQFAERSHLFIDCEFYDSHQRPVRSCLNKDKLAEVLVYGN